MAETQTILDLDSLLDSTTDAVPDVPDFVDPPSGAYVIKCEKAVAETYKSKDGAEGTRIRLTYSVVETLELASEADLPVPNGSLFSETFQATEMGLSFFKRQAKKLLKVESLDGVSVRDILNELTSFEGTVTIRAEKNAQGYVNLRINPTA